MIRSLSIFAMGLLALFATALLVGCSYERSEAQADRRDSTDINNTDHKRTREDRIRDAREDSDNDIAVFLDDLNDRWKEFGRLGSIETDLLSETGILIHSMPYPAGAYRERTPLMHEIRQDGLEL